MSKVVPIHPRVHPQQMTPENKCSFCTNSTCCNYITQHIDTPRSMEDFDTLLWQVAHEHTQLYKDSDGWFLLVNNRCVHLLPDGRCGIYEKRPQICREHSNDDCEFNSAAEDDDFELYFPDFDSLDKYCRKRFKSWDRRFRRWNKTGS